MANVPNVPGVPTLPSYAAGSFVLLAADTIIRAILQQQQTWGIYLDGIPAFDFNSVVNFDFKQDWPISDYPVEQGGFQSYDKVELPFDVRFRIASGGTVAERQQFLDAIEQASKSLDLFDAVTPEKVYLSCNISHYDYRRSNQNGVGMIVADIWLTEIRVTATSTFTNTQSPSNAGNQNIGVQQPQAFGASVQPFSVQEVK